MFNFIFAHIFFFLLPPDYSQVTPYDYTQVYENSVELMTDPFGNYLMQKLVERCTDEQRTVIAQKVRRPRPCRPVKWPVACAKAHLLVFLVEV